jgi:AcrR family transcriptional regulator
LSAQLAKGGLLGAAGKVFARQGFAATTVEDILEEAGIARRTFYKHFANKEDVLAAIYEVATRDLLAQMRSAGSSGTTPVDAIRRGLDVYLDHHAANGRLVGVLVRQAIRDDSPLAPQRQRFRDELVTLLDDAVRATTGERNDRMLYAALISALEGTSLEILSQGAGPTEVARVKRVMHLLLDRALLLDGRPR